MVSGKARGELGMSGSLNYTLTWMPTNGNAAQDPAPRLVRVYLWRKAKAQTYLMTSGDASVVASSQANVGLRSQTVTDQLEGSGPPQERTTGPLTDQDNGWTWENLEVNGSVELANGILPTPSEHAMEWRFAWTSIRPAIRYMGARSQLGIRSTCRQFHERRNV
jgi:hypothetical protein